VAIRRTDDFTISQLAVDVFGTVTADIDPSHTDPEWAERLPYGGTIVQGACSLAFVPWVLRSAGVDLDRYGFSRLPKVRFVEPLRVGAPVSGEVSMVGAAEYGVKLVARGSAKPVLAAEVVLAEGSRSDGAPAQWRVEGSPAPLPELSGFREYFEALRSRVGEPVAASAWLAFDQTSADCYARAVRDYRSPYNALPLEVAVERQSRRPVHPFLLLTRAMNFAAECGLPWVNDDIQFELNYGFDDVVWSAPVAIGGPVRSHVWLDRVEVRGDGYLVGIQHYVERDGAEDPCLSFCNLIYYLPA
jgi:acyl dehydratase